MRRAWLLAVASCVLVAASPDLDLGDALFPPEQDEVVSLLEETSTLQGTRQCAWVGDLHFRSNLRDGGNNGNYNVMGEEEWIFIRSKLHNGKPWFEMQGTQLTWNREMGGGNFYCKRKYPHITVGKSQAFRCGDFMMVYEAAKGTVNSGNCPNDPEVAPNTDYNRFFVKGTRTDQNGNNPQGTYDFAHFPVANGNWYYFGSQVRFYVHWLNCQNGCGKHDNKGVAFDFYCGTGSNEVKIATRGNACCAGALYVDTYATIPDSNNRNGLVSDETMTGGLCAGYDTSTQDGVNVRNALNTCKRADRTANTYAYISGSRGQPGHTGQVFVGGHMRGTSTFYTQDPCRGYFIAKETDSMFRLFELKTQGKNPSYDSARWGGDGQSEYQGDPYAEDTGKKTKAQQDCTTYRKTVDNRDLDDLRTDDPKDVLLRTAYHMCWEDEYLNVPWSEDVMQENFCQSVQGLIDHERKDMHCANEFKMGVQFPDQAIATCSEPASITLLEQRADVVTGYLDEMEDSQNAIEYWDDGTCSIDATDFEEQNLDCAHHTFTNSRLIKNGQVGGGGGDEHH